MFDLNPIVYQPRGAAPFGMVPAQPPSIRLAAREQAALQSAIAESASGVLVWDIFSGDDRIGQIGLDVTPTEFDRALSRHCPALRVYIAPAWRGEGFATAAVRAFMTLLRSGGFRRPLLASHAEDDEAARRVLTHTGFIYTGCRSRGRHGELLHMIKMPDES